MLTKIFRWFLLGLLISPFLVLPTAVLLSSPEPSPEPSPDEIEAELESLQKDFQPDGLRMPYVGEGKIFVISNEVYPNLRLESTQPIRLVAETVTQTLSFIISPITGTHGNKTSITLSGIEPFWEGQTESGLLYRHSDGLFVEVHQIGASGEISWVQNIKTHHHIYILPTKASLKIGREAIGQPPPPSPPYIYDDPTRTYTLAQDINEPVVIVADDITFDGQDPVTGELHKITGPGYGLGIYLYGRTGVTIMKCDVKSFAIGIFLGWSSNYNTIAHNITNQQRRGIQLFRSHNNQIIENTSNLNHWAGIFLNWSRNNLVANNSLDSNEEEGIWLYDGSSHNTVTGNTLTKNKRDGIYLYYNCYYNVIILNKMDSNRLGIRLSSYCNRNLIKDNNALNNSNRGIGLSSCSYNTICTNTADLNGAGILLNWSSNFNKIINNRMKSNGIGVRMYQSCNNNTLVNNTITSNKWGLRLSESPINAIYRNNIYDNTTYNVWFDRAIELSYEGQGNWWGHGPEDPALFTELVDSNIYGVIDSHPYAYQDAWWFGIAPGVVPGVYEIQPHQTIATLDVGPSPRHLAVTPIAIPPARLKAYVLNYDDTISVIDVVNNTVTATIDIGQVGIRDICAVAFSPLGKYAYVSHRDGITIIDVLEDKIIQTLSYPGYLGWFRGIAVSPCGRYLYALASYPDELWMIDTITYTIVKTISLLDYPSFIEVSPDGLEAYITYFRDFRVTVVDFLKGEIKDVITSIMTPFDVAFTRAGDKVYITNEKENELLELDTSTREILRTIPLPGEATYLAVTPDGQYAYISTGHFYYSICVVDLTTEFGDVVADIPIGEPWRPGALAISRYVSNCYAVSPKGQVYVLTATAHLYQGPRIRTISPPEGGPDTTVTISGGGFNPVLEENIIHFGISSLPATSVNPEGTELTFQVPLPTCCGTHRVWVEAWGRESNVVKFYVLKPSGETTTIVATIEDFIREFLAIYGSSHSKPARPGVNLLNKVIDLLAGEKGNMSHLSKLDRGQIVAALNRIEQAIRFLEQWDKMYAQETGLSTEPIRERLACYARTLLKLLNYKAEQKAETTQDYSRVWKAEENIASGSSAIEEEEYLAAGHEFKTGATRIVSLKPEIVIGKSETQANWDALPHLPAYIGVGETLEVGFLIDNTKFDEYIYVTEFTIIPSANISWTYEGYPRVNNTIDLTRDPIMIGKGETSEHQIKVTCLASGEATLTLMVDYEYDYWDKVSEEWVRVKDSTDPCTGTTNQIEGDLDIVHFTDDNEHVADVDEEKGSKGACLSLDRGANHLRPILIRKLEPDTITEGEVKLVWTSKKIEIYENKDKTPESKINSGKTYGLDKLPKRLYVEATADSTGKAKEEIKLQYVPPGEEPIDCDKVNFTNFKVTITIRDGSVPPATFSPQAENDKRNGVVEFLGNQDKLGKLNYRKSRIGDYWYGGSVEVVGQLSPKLQEDDFYADEFYWRQNCTEYIWLNYEGPEKKKDNDPNDPLATSQDRTPSATAKIYYVDAPSFRLKTSTLADLGALRGIYTAWCTFKYHDEPMGCGCKDTHHCPHIQKRAKDPISGYRICSDANKNYGLRATLRDTGTGGGVADKRDDESCTNGNVFGEAVQRLNYDLKAPVVTSITPNSGKRGTTITITDLAGKVFVKPPLKVELIKGAVYIRATDVAVKSKNKIECKFSISPRAQLSNWNVKVTNYPVDDDGDGIKEPGQSSNVDITFKVTD